MSQDRKEFNTQKIESLHDLTVRACKTSKDDIEQPELSKLFHIPSLCTSTIVIGRSGSGKSVCVSKLLNDPNMFGDKFDLVCLISPTAKMDDVQKTYPVTNEHCIIENLSEAPAFLTELMEIQRKFIEDTGAGCAPQVCIILDDCVADKKFINSKEFFEIFMKSRHYCVTVLINAQQYKSISKKARLQANNIIWFKSPMSETENLLDDHCPPGMKKKEFGKLVEFATREPYSFLYINMKAPWKERYRRNFNEIINF